jgi:hypothetical protein
MFHFFISVEQSKFVPHSMMRPRTLVDNIPGDVYASLVSRVNFYQRETGGRPVLFLPLNTTLVDISSWEPSFRSIKRQGSFRLNVSDAFPRGDRRAFHEHMSELIFDILLFITDVTDSQCERNYGTPNIEILQTAAVEELRPEWGREKPEYDMNEIVHVMIFTVSVILTSMKP